LKASAENEVSTRRAARFVDLFCGIGGFRFAVEEVCRRRGLLPRCVLSSDIDAGCQEACLANFGERPRGDITLVEASAVPDHDLLLAGFPCQPFSIIGRRRGFEDTRGTLFFEIARILEAKKPAAFVLENVKLLARHDKGRTLARILGALRGLGYHVDYRILNALHFGLPQKRERIFIIGARAATSFVWPAGGEPMTPLSRILEKDVPKKFYASNKIRQSRWSKLTPGTEPAIWHENKSGHVTAHPYSCALRAGASHNYLLVDGERRLTPREMLRLQGFPETFQIVGKTRHIRKQAGNSLPVPVAAAVLESLFESLRWEGVPAKRH
jgi:DNA (cytosine-5)-methyltransferase 1